MLKKTNMTQYYLMKYKKRLDAREPLIFVNKGDQVIYLPSSLCHETALPDKVTTSAKTMRELSTYKVSNPTDRFERTGKSTKFL